LQELFDRPWTNAWNKRLSLNALLAGPFGLYILEKVSKNNEDGEAVTSWNALCFLMVCLIIEWIQYLTPTFLSFGVAHILIRYHTFTLK
jgi:hypothetical protein